jgi:biotin carboxyl carrier protein
MRFVYRLGQTNHEVEVVPVPAEENGAALFDVTIGGVTRRVGVRANEDGTVLLADGASAQCTARVSKDGASRYVSIRGVGEAVLERVEIGRTRRHRDTSDSLSAPMPGKVVAVRVTEGDTVTTGQVLAVVEAMKMEMPITAPHAGRVARVNATAGELCDAGETLIELKEESA